MYTISKTFTFSAAHALVGLPEGHQCSRFHGHNYVIKLVLESHDLNSSGFVRDYGELAIFKQLLDDTFDHRWLGYGELGRVTTGMETDSGPAWITMPTQPVLDFNPTAENMARHIYEVAATLFPELQSVGVSETEKTWAYYAPKVLTLGMLETAIGTMPEPERTNFRTALRRHHE
jgi:6-pyruvoyltetrahydropterin/6-carboxytetrahydropterin synthase